AKMLGHTNVQMTRHYARVLDRTVIREMSQIKMDFHFPFNKDDSSVIVE
ncbi:MAG: site-specific integrase, partial [Clostridia bacterium]